MNTKLTNSIKGLLANFDSISTERKERLAQITGYIHSKRGKACLLNFICTHNSRRSQISQIMAMVAAKHYNITNIECFSGGTEATAFNHRAVEALQDFGFELEEKVKRGNPIFVWKEIPQVDFLSKVYNEKPNPRKDFCAIMTCSEADANCPLVLGAEKRISLPFIDPKEGDHKPDAQDYYEKAVLIIGTEILYAFSKFK